MSGLGLRAEKSSSEKPDFATPRDADTIDPNGKTACTTAGVLGKAWSVVSAPFCRSIRSRFHITFAFAITGLLIMSLITIASGWRLIDLYETGAEETRFELVPAYELQAALHRAERLASLYVADGDGLVQAEFKQIGQDIDHYFAQMSRIEEQFGELQHAHSHISMLAAEKDWREARALLLPLFENDDRTEDMSATLPQILVIIDSIDQTIAEFHRLSLEDFQDRMAEGREIVRHAFYQLMGAILIGTFVLGFVVLSFSRSILGPIEQLLEVAEQLGKKNFSHRVHLRNTEDELGRLGNAFNLAADSLRHLYEELERRSTHDGLTGVLNRRAFDERLAAKCKRGDRYDKPVSLLMLDIDFFKNLNDAHGHQAGDHVLRQVALLLGKVTRPEDLIARYGGEEFAVILPDTDEESAIAMAERIRETIEMSLFECGASDEIEVTASIGCATRHRHAFSMAEFIKTADLALYRAKASGRNRVIPASELPRAQKPKRRQNPAA